MSLPPAEEMSRRSETFSESPRPSPPTAADDRHERSHVAAAPAVTADMSSWSAVERLSVQQLLASICTRLNELEASLTPSKKPASRDSAPLEVVRLVFGHWPAFAFLFLALFFAPLREVLRAIPEKIRAANEIALPGGLTLKGTIERVAARVGQGRLAAVIPGLSSNAIGQLLRAPRNEVGLVSFTPSADNRDYLALYLPSAQMAAAMDELQEKGLVTLTGDAAGVAEKVLTGDELLGVLAAVRVRLPGKEQSTTEGDRIRWEFKTPQPRNSTELPRLTWQLTDAGANASDLIMRAVAEELATREPAPAKP